MGALRSRIGFIVRGFRGLLAARREAWPEIPAALQPETIGISVESRPIVAYRVGTGDTGVLVAGGIHGNEAGSIRAARHLLAWLASEEARFPHLTFTVIPSLNPDGRAVAERHPDYFGGGRQGRFNARGVDLNRNFATPSFRTESVWSTGKDYGEQIKVFCGAGPRSEPETQALAELVRATKAVLLVSLHNVAPDVMGNAMPLSQELARIFSAASGYPPVSMEEWAALGQTGTAREWCDVMNISYLEVEGRHRWTADWEAHRQGFEAAFSRLETAAKEATLSG